MMALHGTDGVNVMMVLRCTDGVNVSGRRIVTTTPRVGQTTHSRFPSTNAASRRTARAS